MTSRNVPSSRSPDPRLSEAERIAEAQRGDVTAVNQLVLTYQDLAFNVARRLVGNDDAACDVTQDAFWSAYRHLDQFKGGSFRAWLLRIVTNASYDLLRARQRNARDSLDQMMDETSFDAPDPGDLPEALVLRQETMQTLEEAIQQLPFEQRSVIVLCDVQGLSYEETAAALQINSGTLKSRLSRARRRLRDSLVQRRELWE
ncbi:MAG TPA: sigma-70 family RNA polymerase sigma factor [Chloroflexota bacterium]|nr:sigma-70 family RNA polymerase sigma factor [Chloroflexota bacterium]